MSLYPSNMLSVEKALKLYGGWSRLFRKSKETWDKENIIVREGEIGFWETYAKCLADEQFRNAVEEAVEAFRIEYPEIKLPKKELRKKLAEALLEEGWKPVKTRIIKEIRDLRRKKREEIACLKKSIQKPRKPKTLQKEVAR